MFNSEVEEQLHLKFGSNKNFSNMMTPINHIYLFQSIIDNHNSNKNSNFMKSLRQKTHFPVTLDALGRLQYETSLKANNNSVGLPLSTITQDGNKENEVETEGFHSKKHCQISLNPSTIKKVKLSVNESHSKITNEVIGNNDDIESKLDLQDLNISSQTSFWIPALRLSIADKHLILSSETLPDIVMNAAIKKLNDLIVPYSVQGHNYFTQEIRARSSQYLPCYEKSSGKFLQILRLYNYHWVAVTNFDLDLSDEPDQKRNEAVVYILDPFLKASYRH